MINNKKNQKENQIPVQEIQSQFISVLQKTNNLNAAVNYIHLMTNQPQNLTEKQKLHFSILNWLQDIGEDQSSEIFSFKCPQLIQKIVDRCLLKYKLDMLFMIEGNHSKKSKLSPSQKQLKAHKSSIKIAWLSSPMIMVQKKGALDMLKLFYGQHYLSSTDCECQINMRNKSKCNCTEELNTQNQILYFVIKKVKKNIIKYYNNAPFAYKIKQLEKIQKFTRNSLKYSKNQISKVFQMNFQELQRQRDLQKITNLGKKIQKQYYQDQQKISLALLDELDKQQEQQRRKKEKPKTKKNKKGAIKDEFDKNDSKEELRYNKQIKQKEFIQQNNQKQSVKDLDSINKKEAFKQDQYVQHVFQENLMSNTELSLQQTTYKDQQRNSLGFLQQINEQVCPVLDSSKLQTNSNTPSNTCIQNSSDKAQKDPQLTVEQYQTFINPELQAETIKFSVIQEMISNKMIWFKEEIAKSYDLKMIVLNQIASTINRLYPLLTFQVFGSTVTGLALPGSDLDILVDNTFYYIYQQPDLLKRLSQIFKKEYWVLDYQCLSSAKVPVIKLVVDLSYFMAEQELQNFLQESQLKLKVDITLNSLNGRNSGLQSSQLMQYVLSYAPNLKESILILKMMLTKYDLHQNYTGGISSYTLFLLAISYVQFYKVNIYQLTSAEIIISIIQFYANQFNHKEFVVRYNKADKCFLTFDEYYQFHLGSQQALEESGILKVIDPVNNKLIKASYSEFNQVISLFKTLNQSMETLRKKCLQVMETLMLENNIVDNSIVLKIAEQNVKKSQQLSNIYYFLF